MSSKKQCSLNPSISIDIESYSQNDINTIGVNINGEICHLTTKNAEKFAEELSNLAKKINSDEASKNVHKPQCWEDYLLDAKYKNQSYSTILIGDEAWIINHDNIREFIADYTMDQYSQIFNNLEEMSENGLIERA